MTFFTEKWAIVKMNLENILLVRKSKKNIFLEKIIESSEKNKEIANDVLEEYDVALSQPNIIYIIYQNQEKHLILNVLKENKTEKIKLTLEPLPDIFDLNIETKDKEIHIFYLLRLGDRIGKYEINHHYYDGSKWRDYLVEEIQVGKALNPIKILPIDRGVLLSYYRNEKEIVIKRFSTEKLEWSNAINLVVSNTEKLYLDMIMIDSIIHLTYCEFMDGNLVVKYSKLNIEHKDKTYEEQYISNEGSPSHPTIIYFSNKLWITWVELNKVISRCSDDKGETWGALYMWNNSRNIDFIRYKYISMDKEDDKILNNSFGSIYPEISFIGFGNVEDATEIPLKKKTFMTLTRI